MRLIRKIRNLRTNTIAMNRIFHSRISWHNYLYLTILGFTAFALLWEKHIIVATVIVIFLIILIERVIHTTYIITTNKQLTLSFGRFSKLRTIPISSITEIEKIETLKIGSFHLTSYLLIHYENGHVALTPVKEREFVMYLLKANPTIVIKIKEPN